MELFPAQPDLSLQISPPNSKPSSGWRRSSTEDDEMDLSFWKRALESRNSSISSSTMAKPADNSCFELSLSNYPRVSEPNSNHFNLIHINSSTSSSSSNSNLIHSFHHHHNHNNHHNQLFHHHQMNQGLSPELGFLRPIRGIPVYQNPAAAAASSSSFPFVQHSLDTTTNSTIPSSTSTTTTTTTSNPFPPHHQGLMRSRILSRFPAKRSMRAPRMRWTTTLHARFVHAVELLGGHESKPLTNSSAHHEFSYKFLSFLINLL